MIFALIEADEGHTNTIIVASSRNELMAAAIQMYDDEIASYADIEEGIAGENAIYTMQARESLLIMLNQHQEWTPGRYVLKNVDPHWQQWTLFICENSGHSLG